MKEDKQGERSKEDEELLKTPERLLAYYRTMVNIKEQREAEINLLKLENAALKKKLEKYGDKKKPGRKERDAKWQEMYAQISHYIEQGYRAEETMEMLNISHSTYYRYHHVYEEEHATDHHNMAIKELRRTRA